ncbi:hypothetical protein HPS12939_0742 [Glaesserella parasuis 12939]|uniref:Uncharacterized protein n=1 Tax=Glaesserella parasuis serovar 5 (strain SH0165) TaxID=557723 RepID=B8F3U8_GLAP5|nr:hypothetical protein HAPS_0316 [Glaesserella parasuis SH0165]EQA04306.1 hypothetical protein HPSMNH_0134 [Glaesserella parasuis MN-H]EQA04468.1 hypothetical protein HPSSW114_0132 [Glaesserella parasuis SW114]EQA06050.1 hypothetical protein HPS12939_0742 [Glaesserella parasuis 12939]EQA11072.1 hypothetical protein HPSD74_0316 [Glaesserella parasuis D74]EQA15145.1 hypothetical protein HPS174_0154 [Glaesserella parasuis 174]
MTARSSGEIFHQMRKSNWLTKADFDDGTQGSQRDFSR